MPNWRILEGDVRLIRQALLPDIENALTPVSGNEPPWMLKDIEKSREVVAAIDHIEAELSRVEKWLRLIAGDPLRPYLAVERAEAALNGEHLESEM